MSPTRLFAGVFGAVYVAVGLIGFAVAPGTTTHDLLFFDLNIWHNLVHLAIGGAGLMAFTAGASASRSYARVLAVAYALVAVLGVLPQPLFGILPIGGADIGLHAASALVAAYFGFAAQSRMVARPA